MSFMDHLIGQSVTYCEKKLPPLVNPNIDHAKLNRRRRRRGFKQHCSPDSQEFSEGGKSLLKITIIINNIMNNFLFKHIFVIKL